jgi:hypothetical protein
MLQVIEHPFHKLKVLSSNSSSTRKIVQVSHGVGIKAAMSNIAQILTLAEDNLDLSQTINFKLMSIIAINTKLYVMSQILIETFIPKNHLVSEIKI